MKKWLLILFAWTFIFTSCEKDKDNLTPSQEKHIVIKERDPNYPWTPWQRPVLSRATPTVIGLKDCVGRSLKCNVFPIENMENLGYPVIDMDKLTKDYPSYFTSWRIGTGLAESFSYASFDRFIENSSIQKKVSSGFSLNLGIFKIGHKKKMTEIFSTSSIESKQSVFGMLNVLIRDSCYNLQLSSNIKDKIILNYLHEIFKDELYNTSPSEFFSNYGGFVLSRYVTGGQALGYYCGTYKTSDITETKEDNMNKEISASFGFKKDSASGNLGIGKDFANGHSSTYKFSSLRTSIQTVGGSPEFIAASIPQDINTINVDLTGWMRSLNDKRTLSIIDIEEDGLLPITDFIIEDNLKDSIFDIYKNGVKAFKPLQEPRIIIRVGIMQMQGGEWKSYLITRYGEKYLLRFARVEGGSNMYRSINNEILRLSEIFGVKIELSGTPIDDNWKDYPADGSNDHTYDNISFSQMNKFIDEDGTIYLLHNKNSAYYAFTIHSDRTLDEYVMRNFVNRLPIANITRKTLLQKYKIIAL